MLFKDSYQEGMSLCYVKLNRAKNAFYLTAVAYGA